MQSRLLLTQKRNWDIYNQVSRLHSNNRQFERVNLYHTVYALQINFSQIQLQPLKIHISFQDCFEGHCLAIESSDKFINQDIQNKIQQFENQFKDVFQNNHISDQFYTNCGQASFSSLMGGIMYSEGIRNILINSLFFIKTLKFHL